jgi:hypothetical protein
MVNGAFSVSYHILYVEIAKDGMEESSRF